MDGETHELREVVVGKVLLFFTRFTAAEDAPKLNVAPSDRYTFDSLEGCVVKLLNDGLGIDNQREPLNIILLHCFVVGSRDGFPCGWWPS